MLITLLKRPKVVDKAIVAPPDSPSELLCSMSRSLIIFAKRPTPGRVKTRLIPTLSPEEAADLYRRMLLDTIRKASEMTGVVRLLFYEQGEGAEEYFSEIAGGDTVCPQEGDDLGERMAGAFRLAFGMGCGEVAIIGTDSPDLPSALIARAYELLQEPEVDVVFGPSEDGGYYLLAAKRLHPELFIGIPWSTGEVLDRSLARAAEAGLRVELLPAWYDVDSAEDLLRPGLVAPDSGAPLTRGFILTYLRSPRIHAVPDGR
jgi:rSAM/selenodomain-associated transferase 1